MTHCVNLIDRKEGRRETEGLTRDAFVLSKDDQDESQTKVPVGPILVSARILRK